VGIYQGQRVFGQVWGLETNRKWMISDLDFNVAALKRARIQQKWGDVFRVLVYDSLCGLPDWDVMAQR
jgi:hypothetical protein